MTTVRLATGLGNARTRAALRALPAPALLVSYAYKKKWTRWRGEMVFRDWMLDSGAFTAHTTGAAVDLDKYTAHAKALLDRDPLLAEVIALDVIGDWRATRANTERMWRAGVPAIPVFHANEPLDVLRGYARDYPKVALGGVVGATAAVRRAFAVQCLAAVWPARIHGLGLSGEETLAAAPFHSVDASSWEVGPLRFGKWRAYEHNYIRSKEVSLRPEVEWYLRLERKAQALWAREMGELARLPPLPRKV